MIGRDRDVVDVLVMHGWFAVGGMPSDNDRRISTLFQHDRGLTGLCRTQRASYHELGLALLLCCRCTAQGRLLVSQGEFQPCSGT